MAAKSSLSLRLLEAIYSDKSLSLDEANELNVTDAKHVNAVSGGNKAINYGEMTAESWSGVLEALKPLGKHDKFVDLGSGRGTLVVQAALEVWVRVAFRASLAERIRLVSDTTGIRD